MSYVKIAILGMSALAMSACATNQGENAADAQGSTDTMSAPAGDTTTGTGADATTINTTTGTTNQMDAMTPVPGTTTNTTTSDPGMMGTTNTGTANEANSTSPPQ